VAAYRASADVSWNPDVQQDSDDQREVKRFRWGFIASIDTHTARAGHGFKQTNHRRTTVGKAGRSGPGHLRFLWTLVSSEWSVVNGQ
jgi:hypothetical protein